MSYLHIDNQDRWNELETDPAEAIFGESISSLPWNLREELDVDPEAEKFLDPISEVTL